MTAAQIVAELRKLANPAKVKDAAWFFKTGPGQYGAGDQFLGGLKVPVMRKIARAHRVLPLPELKKLLASRYHEGRFVALEILVMQFERAGDEGEHKQLLDFYLAQLDHVNNWDLVDTSAPYILGTWLVNQPDDTTRLTALAQSGHLWRERASIVATQTLIRAGRFGETLRLAKRFLTHQHDLIHKAVGWMLREVGQRDLAVLTHFLDRHATAMPRTMLRYAIEKLPEARRQHYLKLPRE